MVDFHDPRLANPETRLRHIAKQMNVALTPPYNYDRFLDAVSENISQPTVMLIDGISVGLAARTIDPSFWQMLYMLSGYGRQTPVGFVATLQLPLEYLLQEHPEIECFAHLLGHELVLGPIDQASALELISSSPIPFPEEDTAWILEKSMRWPFLLQILCNACLTALESEEASDLWRKTAERRLAAYQYLAFDQSAEVES